MPDQEGPTSSNLPEELSGNPTPEQPQFAPPEQVDPGAQSLADALQFSFTVLKILMVLLVIGYACSGVFQVNEQQVAVRLRFGEIVGENEKQVYSQGWHFGLPFPFEERIKIDTTAQTLEVKEAFSPETTEQQATLTREERAGANMGQGLNPEKDGSLITGDANLAHGEFIVSYQIPPQPYTNVIDFVNNVGDMESARRLVEAAVERGAVFAAAQVTTDEILTSSDKILSMTKNRSQDILDELNTGIRITKVSVRTDIPDAVILAFNAVNISESQRGQLIDAARQEATRILGGAAGAAQEALSQLVTAYELADSAKDEELIALLDGVMSATFDRLRIDPQQPELLAAVDAYRQALANGDTELAEQSLEQAKVIASQIIDGDPRRQLLDEISTLLVAIEANGDPAALGDQYDELIQNIEQMLADTDEATMASLSRVQEALSAMMTAAMVSSVEVPEEETAQVADESEGETQTSTLEETLAGARAATDAFETQLNLEGITIGGEVAQAIFQAESYRTEVVSRVQAEARRFEQLLTEYEKNPRIVRSRLWATARENIFTSPGVETIYAMPSRIRLDVNRDPEVQRAREEAAIAEQQAENQ